MAVRETPNIRRLEDLFPRYWDSALTSSELAEFEQILTTDPEARQVLLLLSMQVVAPVELSAIVTQLPAPPPAPTALSRRRLLQFAGGGLALGVAGLAGGLGWWLSRGRDADRVWLESVRGLVHLNSGGEASAGMHLPTGSVL